MNIYLYISTIQLCYVNMDIFSNHYDHCTYYEILHGVLDIMFYDDILKLLVSELISHLILEISQQVTTIRIEELCTFAFFHQQYNFICILVESMHISLCDYILFSIKSRSVLSCRLELGTPHLKICWITIQS